MTKIELLKQCAAQGMTARQAAEAVGCLYQYAATCAIRGGFKFAPAKMGGPTGKRKAPLTDGINLDAAAQIVAEVEALPPAKLPLYRALRLEAGFQHARAMELVA